MTKKENTIVATSNRHRYVQSKRTFAGKKNPAHRNVLYLTSPELIEEIKGLEKKAHEVYRKESLSLFAADPQGDGAQMAIEQAISQLEEMCPISLLEEVDQTRYDKVCAEALKRGLFRRNK